MQKEARTKVEH